MRGLGKPGPKPKSVADRFWSKVDMSGGPDACWPWTYCRDGREYGMFSMPKSTTKMARAHRVALGLHLGRPLTDEEEACHECDNPPCCNPSHLFVGSHADNMADLAGKNSLKGEQASRAKVSQDQFEWARTEWEARRLTQSQIAQKLGIHKSHASRLVRGLTGHKIMEHQSEG